jgi:hypothetical protein
MAQLSTQELDPIDRIWTRWRSLRYLALALLVSALILACLLWLRPENPQVLSLQVGSVSPQDIMAPLDISFQSEVLTEQQRSAAAQSISPVYSIADPQIARTQAEKLSVTLDYMDSLRADQEASLDDKLTSLAELPDLDLPTETMGILLTLAESDWVQVEIEAISVLQQVMRSTIREDQIESVRHGVPSLVSLSLNGDQASLVAELVSSFIQPNSFYSEELTNSQREEASAAVEPVSRRFVAGETVVSRGQVLSEADIEALEQLGLLSGSLDTNRLVRAASFTVAAMVFFTLVISRNFVMFGSRPRVAFLVIATLVVLFAGRVFILGHTVRPFVFPFALYGLLVGGIFRPKLGLLFSIPLTMLVTFGMSNAVEINTVYIISAAFGTVMLGQQPRIKSFLWSGLGAGIIGAAIIAAYRMNDPFTDLIGLITLIAAATSSGIIAGGVAALLHFLIAPSLGMTTSLQLLELSRPDRPLLRRMMVKAPGTYQHSLQVANLAEQAAEQIGADTLLTRIGALYHDIGKTVNPHFFIENQIPGTPSPHLDLSPAESSAYIVGHVVDGVEMAKRHKLPKPIAAFIAEHHGTLITTYQYAQALDAAGGDSSALDMESFRYPGPRPQSRETALIMIADGCEARARAEKPQTGDQIRIIVDEIIEQRWQAHQFDDTDLSAKDLQIVRKTLASTLRGIYHPRIEYPKLDANTEPRADRGPVRKADPPQLPDNTDDAQEAEAILEILDSSGPESEIAAPIAPNDD